MQKIGSGLLDGFREMAGVTVLARGHETYTPREVRKSLKTIVVGCIVQRKEMADFAQGRRGHVKLIENSRAFVHWFDGPHGFPVDIQNWVDLDDVAFLGFATDHA